MIMPRCSVLAEGMTRNRREGPWRPSRQMCSSVGLGPGVQLAGHLARELEIGALAVPGVEWKTKGVRATRSLPDLEFRCEAEHRVLDRRRRPVGPRVRLKGDVGLARNAERVLRHADGCPLHPDVLADQRLELAERPADLTRDDLLNRLGLLVGGALVDDDPDLPVPGGEVRGEPVVEGEADAPEIDVVEAPLLDAERERTAALATLP